jgi:hypothetical protein
MEFTTVQWIIFGALIFIFLVISGVGAGIISYRLKWNLRYEYYKKTNGIYYRIRKGRCRKVPFGTGGEHVYYLKGLNVYKSGFGKSIAKNTIAWFEAEDGYWYNCQFKDLDKQRNQIGFDMVQTDMRLINASLRKGIENMYKKQNFMEKYGVFIAFGMLFLCIIAMGGFMWVGLNKVNGIISTAGETLKTQKEVIDLSKEVLTQVANVKSGGTGYIQVAR